MNSAQRAKVNSDEALIFSYLNLFFYSKYTLWEKTLQLIIVYIISPNIGAQIERSTFNIRNYSRSLAIVV